MPWLGVAVVAWVVAGPMGGIGGQEVDLRASFTDVTSVTMTGFGSEDIQVVAGPAGSTDVTVRATGRTSRLGGTPTQIIGTRSGTSPGDLTVASACDEVRMCSLTYIVTVPPNAAVSAEVGSGDIEVRGVGGQVRAIAGSGDLQLDAVSGPVAARANSGDVTVSRFSGPSIEAEANSGDVEIDAESAPESITVDTGSGDISLRVPEGEQYAVSEESGSGDGTVEVPRDDRSQHRISVSVGSGDYSIEHR